MTILHYVTNLHTDFVISFFWMLAECYVSHMAMMQYNWFFFVCWWNVTYVSHMAMMKYNLTFVFRMLAQCLVSHMAIMFFFFCMLAQCLVSHMAMDFLFVCWRDVLSPRWQWWNTVLFFFFVCWRHVMSPILVCQHIFKKTEMGNINVRHTSF